MRRVRVFHNFSLAGTGLLARSELNGGQYESTASSHPLVTLEREGNGQRTVLSVQAWSDTQVQVALPSNLAPGLYWTHVKVAGDSAQAQVLRIGRLDGEACGAASDCLSGTCSGCGVGLSSPVPAVALLLLALLRSRRRER